MVKNNPKKTKTGQKNFATNKKSAEKNKITDKTIKFFKEKEYPRYIFKLTTLFLGCAIALILISSILKPSLENYDKKLDKSYIKEIFDLEGIKIDELRIKDITKQYASNIKKLDPAKPENPTNKEKIRVYSVFMRNNKIGWAVKVLVDGCMYDTHYKNYTKNIFDKMMIMVGGFTDTSLAGIRVMNHKDSLRLTNQMESKEYISHLSSDSIKSKNRSKIIKKKDIPQNTKDFKKIFGVDEMSGACRTSMALMNSINTAYEIMQFKSVNGNY